MPKTSLSLKLLSISLIVFANALFSYGQSEKGFYRLVDSADFYLDDNTEKALSFLEDIPKPVENYISGRVAEYYSLKAIIHDDFNEFAEYYQCVNLAIKFGEIEKEYCIAGEVCVSMFSNLYFMDKHSMAYPYLDKARDFYKNCDKKYGIFEVEQVEAYAKYLDGEHEESNRFLLSKLDTYKAVSEDPYYQMFALYMITSNYIWMEDFNHAHKYFKEFKALEGKPKVIKLNYYAFKGAINSSFADNFFKDKQLDSTRFYLEETSKVTDYLAVDVLKDYYRLSSEFYKHLGEVEISLVYTDSLLSFQSHLYKKTIEGSIEINDSFLLEDSDVVEKGDSNEIVSSVLGGVSVAVLLAFSIFCFVIYKKQKKKLLVNNLDANNNLSYLKSNNDQLTTKVYGLETYIKNLKQEIKQISITEGVEFQKDKIKELYRNLHINSSTLLDKTGNHLELVNEFNIEFFKKIETDYPQLKKTETIICYYLLMGFSNKEIAVFFNTTIRSVESRRYRVSKKIEFNNEEETLLEFLERTFSDTLSLNTTN
ncbi:hypothetical protein AAFN75_13120 [Algibacter sp. AS12]|uniref:helix-turn-helix transcriptional regulator n=1 Tax=Algibacter sp. AS12 TaxID=3135773 RepID=UPI00398AB238